MDISQLDKKAKRLRIIKEAAKKRRFFMEQARRRKALREKAKKTIPISGKEKTPGSITKKATNPGSITKKAKTPGSISYKGSNPRQQKPGNTQQKNQIIQGGNSKKLKSANKSKMPPVSRSPFFDKKIYNVMTAREQVDYLDKLEAIPRYKTSKMTKLEAMDAIDKIRSNTCSTMRLCYELATRKGYKALGYKDFKECVMKELAGVIGYDYAHKMKNAGEVHVVICPEIPMGTVPESVLRPMHGLSDENMKKVWNSNVEELFDGTPIIPTARDIICTKKSLGLAGETPYIEDMKWQFRHTVFSPKLLEKLKENILELIKEYIEKSSINPTPPVSKEHFEKVVRILLTAFRTATLGEYEKSYGQKK